MPMPNFKPYKDNQTGRTEAQRANSRAFRAFAGLLAGTR
jgi:hypothetical protein